MSQHIKFASLARVTEGQIVRDLEIILIVVGAKY